MKLSNALNLRLLVVLNVERFISVWRPYVKSKYFTLKILLVTSLIILMISIAVNLHFIWTLEFENEKCYQFPPKQQVRSTILQFLSLFLNTILPFIMIITLNIAIIYKLRSLNKVILSKIRNRSSRKITRAFVLTTTLFVILLLPLRIFVMYKLIDAKTKKVYDIIERLIRLLAYTYYALSFSILLFNFPNINKKLIRFLQKLRS